MENDLKFTGQNPVIINFNGDTEDIYAPVKTSSLDVDIVSDQILDDLYSANIDEIAVSVKKKEPKKIWVQKFTDDGSVVSTQTSVEVGEEFTITYRNLFYKDMSGNFRFNGEIQDTNSNREDVNLLWSPSRNKWVRNDAYNMSMGDEYFYDDNGEWYVTSWHGTYWTIRKGNGHPVLYNVGGSSSSAPSTNNIVHYSDGHIELLFGQYRYTWDYEDMEWDLGTAYVDSETGTLNYFAIYGNHFGRVKNEQGQMVDAVFVNGVYDADYSNWIASLDPVSDTFTKMIPLTEETWTSDDVFYNEGDVYVVDRTGYIYVWSWNIRQWVKWIQFTGDIQANSVFLDYVIEGDDKNTVVIKYTDTNLNKTQYFHLTDFEAPTVELVEVVVPGEYIETVLWEGYKVPNTYSQDVTLNLDEILLTAIDPVSIMKYLKIDRLFEKPKVVTYAEFFGKAIAYVMLHSQDVLVENTVSYGGDFLLQS